MFYLRNILFTCFFILFIASCSENKNTEPTAANPIANSTSKDIHDVEAYIGHGEGEEVFKANCITCHSLRYIQMQPSFPRKTWEKIVDKMIKNFGAPIADSSAHQIVSYLATVKGK
jgi:mono/diheme cytochrome c family protein